MAGQIPTDKAIKLLKEKTDSRKEYFALLKEYIKKLEKQSATPGHIST